MRNVIILVLVVVGALGALVSAFVSAAPHKPLAPYFNPAPNPYAEGVYARGIVESYQSNGANINLYPEVAGSVVRLLVAEGQTVTKGTPLVQIEDSIQRATVEQLRSQAEAAQALLEELHAEPRRENLQVAAAQSAVAQAGLKTAQDALDKQQASYALSPESVSRDVLDNAINARKVAGANLAMVTRQYELTRAGAWVFDVRNQEKQAEALVRAYAASNALLAKYTIRAPTNGTVMSVGAVVGGYVSPRGVYDTYTQGFDPIVVMGTPNGTLGVRCYVDEILLSRLPPIDKLAGQMFIRGTNTRIPLEFVRLQPYVSSQPVLASQRPEKVDLRVLPVIFRFRPPSTVHMYPGEDVDVYIGED
jgi:HlyD family secretion protein